MKKVIYQIPFGFIEQMSSTIIALEQSVYDQVYMDVEMNSLEDAYINIAKEEEKLLDQMRARDNSQLVIGNSHSEPNLHGQISEEAELVPEENAIVDQVNFNEYL